MRKKMSNWNLFNMDDSDIFDDLGDIGENLNELSENLSDLSNIKKPKGKNIIYLVIALILGIIFNVIQIENFNILSPSNGIYFSISSVICTIIILYLLFKIDIIGEFDFNGFILAFLAFFLLSFAVILFLFCWQIKFT